MMFKVITIPRTDEAGVPHVTLGCPLEVSQLAEGVHNDTKDDVEADCGDEDEESDVVDDDDAKLEESRRVFAIWHQLLRVAETENKVRINGNIPSYQHALRHKCISIVYFLWGGACLRHLLFSKMEGVTVMGVTVILLQH